MTLYRLQCPVTIREWHDPAPGRFILSQQLWITIDAPTPSDALRQLHCRLGCMLEHIGVALDPTIPPIPETPAAPTAWERMREPEDTD